MYKVTIIDSEGIILDADSFKGVAILEGMLFTHKQVEVFYIVEPLHYFHKVYIFE